MSSVVFYHLTCSRLFSNDRLQLFSLFSDYRLQGHTDRILRSSVPRALTPRPLTATPASDRRGQVRRRVAGDAPAAAAVHRVGPRAVGSAAAPAGLLYGLRVRAGSDAAAPARAAGHAAATAAALQTEGQSQAGLVVSVAVGVITFLSLVPVAVGLSRPSRSRGSVLVSVVSQSRGHAGGRWARGRCDLSPGQQSVGLLR